MTLKEQGVESWRPWGDVVWVWEGAVPDRFFEFSSRSEGVMHCEKNYLWPETGTRVSLIDPLEVEM